MACRHVRLVCLELSCIFPTVRLLDLHHQEAVRVNEVLSVLTRGGTTHYFHCSLPIGCHAADDRRALRRRVGELAALGVATPAQLARACDLGLRTVRRALRLWRKQGEAGFYAARKPRARTAVTPEIKGAAEAALALGASLRATARKVGLHVETLRRNILGGVVAAPADSAPTAGGAQALDPARRDLRDTACRMGRAARDVAGRVAASLGALNGRKPRFVAASAVACGGVLAGLPALLQTGLLRHAEELPELAKGFYSRVSVLLLGGLLLLARVRNFEGLRLQAPGEWGALLGLDRCPEVKTMRRLVRQLAAQTEAARAFQAALAGAWLEADGGQAATLCVDGHVKVYSGRKGKLPRHFVSRTQQTLPAASAFWVNALGGQPLGCIHRQVDHGMVQALENDILPYLRETGALRGQTDLTAAGGGEPEVTLVFDREGWSPELFRRLARQGVACITWRKGELGADWPESDFELCETVPLSAPGGERLGTMRLAERSVTLLGEPGEGDGDSAGESGQQAPFRVREIRRLTRGGRQLALVTTHPSLPGKRVAGALASRWAQENFFKYAKQEFGLDDLPEHLLEPVDPSETVRNPAWKDLDSDIRRLRRRRASLRDRATQAIQDAGRRTRAAKGCRGRRAEKLRERAAELRAKARELRQEAGRLDDAIGILAERRRHTPQHVAVGELPEDLRYDAIPEALRHFALTLKMIAYRAETALQGVGGGEGKPLPRAALQALFQRPANLLPDEAGGVLRVQLLHGASRALDRRLEPLVEELSKTRTIYPGTELRLVYEFAC